MLSSKAKYAMNALVNLARRRGGEPAHIRDIAEEEGIPVKYLERILLEMKRTGILQSIKGKGGGYVLSRAPENVTVSEIVRLMDGPLAPVSCVSHTAYAPCRECRDEKSCAIRQVMKGVRDAIAAKLDQATLADLVSTSRKKR